MTHPSVIRNTLSMFQGFHVRGLSHRGAGAMEPRLHSPVRFNQDRGVHAARRPMPYSRLFAHPFSPVRGAFLAPREPLVPSIAGFTHSTKEDGS